MALPVLTKDERDRRIRYAHADNIQPVTMPFWVLPASTAIFPLVSYTADRNYQVQGIDFNVNVTVPAVSFLFLGFSDNPALFGGTSQGLSIFTKAFVTETSGFINMTPSGIYLPIGKKIAVLGRVTIAPGIHFVGSVTLFMVETFEQS